MGKIVFLHCSNQTEVQAQHRALSPSTDAANIKLFLSLMNTLKGEGNRPCNTTNKPLLPSAYSQKQTSLHLFYV